MKFYAPLPIKDTQPREQRDRVPSTAKRERVRVRACGSVPEDIDSSSRSLEIIAFGHRNPRVMDSILDTLH
jgi:hypothetical protein